MIDPSIQFSLNLNESIIPSNNTSLNTSQDQILNQSIQQSLFNKSFEAFSEPKQLVQPKFSKKSQKVREDWGVDLNILENLCVEDILRSLTSKIYKHHKSENYEEFEFIGDVVLKYLSTLQIFL